MRGTLACRGQPRLDDLAPVAFGDPLELRAQAVGQRRLRVESEVAAGEADVGAGVDHVAALALPAAHVERSAGEAGEQLDRVVERHPRPAADVVDAPGRVGSLGCGAARADDIADVGEVAYLP